jgi:hypothetical protein
MLGVEKGPFNPSDEGSTTFRRMCIIHGSKSGVGGHEQRWDTSNQSSRPEPWWGEPEPSSTLTGVAGLALISTPFSDAPSVSDLMPLECMAERDVPRVDGTAGAHGWR